jgi:hypothetical protein
MGIFDFFKKNKKTETKESFNWKNGLSQVTIREFKYKYYGNKKLIDLETIQFNIDSIDFNDEISFNEYLKSGDGDYDYREPWDTIEFRNGVKVPDGENKEFNKLIENGDYEETDSDWFNGPVFVDSRDATTVIENLVKKYEETGKIVYEEHGVENNKIIELRIEREKETEREREKIKSKFEKIDLGYENLENFHHKNLEDFIKNPEIFQFYIKGRCNMSKKYFQLKKSILNDTEKKISNWKNEYNSDFGDSQDKFDETNQVFKDSDNIPFTKMYLVELSKEFNLLFKEKIESWKSIDKKYDYWEYSSNIDEWTGNDNSTKNSSFDSIQNFVNQFDNKIPYKTIIDNIIYNDDKHIVSWICCSFISSKHITICYKIL